MRILKNVVKVVVYGVATVILIASAACMMLQIKPAVVVSGSMEPAIKTGSLIFIDKTDIDLKKGDIAAYRTGDVSVAHRVDMVMDDGSYITKGDANKSLDVSPVTPDMLEGKVMFAIPVAGYFVKKAASLPGILAAASVAVFVAVIRYMGDKEGAGEQSR